MYLSFVEYKNMGGQDIEETTFNDLEFEASAVIDWWTFNRLHGEVVYPEALKKCMYRLIGLILERQSALATNAPISDSSSSVQPGIIQESNDGVSTTYNVMSAKEAISTLDTEIGNIIRMYLQGIRNSLGHKLLYRGVYPDE